MTNIVSWTYIPEFLLLVVQGKYMYFRVFPCNTKNSLIITLLLIIIVYIISDFVEVMENAMNSFISYTCILVDIFGAIWVIFISRPESVIRLGIEKHAIPFFVDLYFLHCWGHIHIYMYVRCSCLYTYLVTIEMYLRMQIHHHSVFKDYIQAN